jgi:glycosyltransferase involved in cell wall biosynthesis
VDEQTIKVLALIEATTITGPAKNLLNFIHLISQPNFQTGGDPRVEFSLATFHRSSSQRANLDLPPNPFVGAARAQAVNVDVIDERFRFDARVIGQLRRIVQQRAPDILQTHSVKSHFILKLAGLAARCKWIAYHHGYTTTNKKMLAYNKLNRWSLPSAERVITVCEPFAAQLAQSGVDRSRIVVCHNSVVRPIAVSEEQQEMTRRSLGVNMDERVVICIGRFSKEKGHADLIAAVGLLVQMNPALKFKLLLAGTGPELEHIRRLATATRLDQLVIFAGHKDDVAPLYAIADALALPSHSEGSPNVLLEAMAAGVPAVATAVGGVPEIAVDNETALLVPPNNPQSFATALNRLLTDAMLAQSLGAAARKRVETEFSPQRYAQTLKRVYEEVASGKMLNA